MTVGVLLGKGMTAEVYKWQQGKALKLFFENIPGHWIEYESTVGTAISHAGLPSPAVYGIIAYKNRRGIVYQEIEGESMLATLMRRPWRILKYARQLAKLHYHIHSAEADNLPLNKSGMMTAIKASEALKETTKEQIIKYIGALPDGSNICHGDFHPDNILLQGNGGAVVIDWSNTYYGSPLSDVARTILIITTPYMPEGTPPLIKMLSGHLKRILSSCYIKEYTRLSKLRQEDIKAWLLPMAAARLWERIPGEEKWLIEIINRELKARA